MKISRGISLAMCAVLLLGFWATTALASGETKIVNDSANVIQEVMRIPEKGIPPAVLKNAKAIAIFPGVIKGAFMVGGEHGRGVMLQRQDGGWSKPSFLTISAGSFGWQIGGEATDLILVFKTLRGVDALKKGKFTLGGDAAVAAGPVGRSAEAAVDVTGKGEILSYSRTKGLFAGLSLEGAALLTDKDANAAYKGDKADKRLQNLLMKYSR